MYRIINAIGPETFTYRELVATIGRLNPLRGSANQKSLKVKIRVRIRKS